MKKQITIGLLFLSVSVLFTQCKKDDNVTGKDPVTAERVKVDRFSASAGHLMVRDASNGLPAANAPINFDVAPFITQGLSATGTKVEYYNFDVQPAVPAPIYVLFKAGATTPVEGQLNIIDQIPGDAGYNDFWLVNKVEVPADYIANTITSFAEIQAKKYAITPTKDIVNCPVVPEGSVASKRLGTESPALTIGWYKGKVVSYFSFNEKALSTVNDLVPTSPIYVTFNINPPATGGGPASGFKFEMGSMQTHNVIATLPTDASYSPLWMVRVYDNTSFSMVNNLSTAQAAPLLDGNAALVNCPVVKD